MSAPLSVRFRRLTALVVAVGVLAVGCGQDWDRPGIEGEGVVEEGPAPAPTAEPTPCDNAGGNGQPPAVASYPPAEIPQGSPPAFPAGSPMAAIQDAGRLRAGTSSGTLLFAAVNPFQDGRIDGFDVDMIRLVAGAIFGVEPFDANFKPTPEIDDLVELVSITSAQRIPKLEAREVDMVALTMTINCTRWQRIAFSSEYFTSGQRVLVRSDSTVTSIGELADQRVCAHAGSTSLENISALLPPDAVVEVPELTDCLVRFQQGTVDAISTDDTILAGFAAQDPYAKVVGEPFTSEPYGLAFNAQDVAFVQFVNAVLDRARADGTWDGLYEKWLSSLGASPGAPVPNHDRPLPGQG